LITIYLGNLFEKTGTTVTNHIFLGSKRIASKTATQVIYYHPDHLGSTNLVTDSKGAQIQLTEYKPYGSLTRNDVIASPEGAKQSQTNYLFTNKELDSSTSLYYYGARYYNPEIGRFISPDPIEYSDEGIKAAGGKNLQAFLHNPESFNRYSYCNNNPINSIDPDGYRTIFIHGTGSVSSIFTNTYISFVQSTFKDSFLSYSFSWTGGNSNSARLHAALALSMLINSYDFAEGEQLNIIAHSHGGNIAFLASQLGLKHKIDNLVILGTPIRNDYQPNKANIGNIFNIYTQYDEIQLHGGKGKWYSFLFGGEAGPAGRTLENAKNINLNINWGAEASHGCFLNQDIWRNYIDNILGSYLGGDNE